MVPDAFYSTLDFDLPQAVPREELHQFLIGVYGDYIVSSTLCEVQQVLLLLNLVLSKPRAGKAKYMVTNEMMCV